MFLCIYVSWNLHQINVHKTEFALLYFLCGIFITGLFFTKVLEERDQWTQVHELVHISWAGAGTQSHFKMDHELELLDKILSSRSSSYCPPSTSKKATIFTRKLAFEEGISGDTLLIKQFAAAKCVQHTRNILADVKVGNFNSTIKTYYYMPWTGAGAGT